MPLIEPFKKKALNLLEEYQAKGMPVENQGQIYPFRQFDEKRMAAIPELNASLQKFINRSIDLLAFKKAHEVLCRKHNFWGMSSFSGQGFLNQIAKWSDASNSVAILLRESFKAPKDKSGCASAIDEITLRLPRLIQRKGLRLASLPNLVSYFWQIQDPERFPIYYASAKNILRENDLLKEEKRSGELYLDFWEISDELFELFSKKVDLEGANRNWFVEHVLWIDQKKNILSERNDKKNSVQLKENKRESWREFIPPVLNDYESLSLGPDSLLFERKTILLFKLLGFNVEGIGQGKGREPDGIALCREDHFAVLFDAKSSSDGFSIGTGDRAIIEYINKYEQRLRREGLRVIYFVLLSSDFKGSSSQAIMNIRKESPAKSVVLITAEQALRILARRIQEPFTFGFDAFEELLLDSGAITEERLSQFLEA